MVSETLQLSGLSFEKVRDIALLLDSHIKHEDKQSGHLILRRSFGLNLEKIELHWRDENSELEITTQFSSTLDKFIEALSNHKLISDSKVHRPLLPTKIRRYLVAGVVGIFFLPLAAIVAWGQYFSSDFYKETYVSKNADTLCNYWTTEDRGDYSRYKEGPVYRKDYYDFACEQHLKIHPEDHQVRQSLARYYVNNKQYSSAEVHYKKLIEQGYYKGYDGLFSLYSTQNDQKSATGILIEKIEAKRLSGHDPSSELYQLSVRLVKGNGIERNYEMARQTFEQSGLTTIRDFNLGKLYYEGIGGPIDKEMAKRLGYEPPKDKIQLYAEQLIKNMNTGGTCMIFQNQIKQVANSKDPENVRQFRIDKILEVANRYYCLN